MAERGIHGTMDEAIAALRTSLNGAALAGVLSLLLPKFKEAAVIISTSNRHATLSISGQKPIGVRTAPPNARAQFRFKRPSNVHEFQAIYFGGLSPDGKACADRLSLAQIGLLKTITTRAIPGMRD